MILKERKRESICMYVCMYVCMREREREREREKVEKNQLDNNEKETV